MIEKLKKVFNTNYYIILIVSILTIAPLLAKGAIIAHDAVYPVTRAIGTVMALKQGQFLPLITSNFANGFGYSWNLFYPPISTYFVIFARIFTSSYYNATKIVVILSTIFSGIFMYRLVKCVSKNDKISLLAAIIYITAPYRLVDIYTRMAIGEIISFIFIPIVFQGLYNLLEGDSDKHYLIVIGAVGLVLTHNISTLMTIIPCIIYVLFNIKKLKNKNIIKKLLIDIIFIIGMVVFFYAPMIEAKLSCNYSVFDDGKMGSLEQIQQQALSISQVLFGKMQNGYTASEMCLIIGLPIILPLIFTPYVYSKISNKKLYVLTLITGLLMLLATTNIFPWIHMPKIFSFIQFAYRFLFIAIFLLSIVAAVNIEKMFEDIKIKEIFIVVFLIFIYIIPILNICQLDSNFNENRFTQVDTVNENTEATESCAYFEYVPSNVKVSYLTSRKQEAIVLSGKTEIVEQNKENTNMNIKIQNTSEETLIELPYIYYVGYKAEINGKKLNVKETENGLVGLDIPKGESGYITIQYRGTKIQKVSTLISIVSFVFFIVYIANKGKGFKQKRLDIK